MSNLSNSDATILVAEDEPILLESIADLLLEIKCKVLTAKNGVELLNTVKSQPIHAILSDINMPQMSGIEALSQLRNLGFDIPFVFLTGYGDAKNISSALKLGAFDFHEKPFDDTQLIETMKSALEYGIALSNLRESVDALLTSHSVPEHLRQPLEAAHRKVGAIRILNKLKRWR